MAQSPLGRQHVLPGAGDGQRGAERGGPPGQGGGGPSTVFMTSEKCFLMDSGLKI